MTRWLGLDIGGANVKAATVDRFAASLPFALWKSPNQLHAAIGQLIRQAPDFEAVAVTMTGELADCYQTREEGVCRILEQLTSVIPAPLVRVYTTQGKWLTPSQAARNCWDVAASNWHGLASYALRWTEGKPALLVDVGSTTIDLIPLSNDQVATSATTDGQRLLEGQLLYMGIERTPLCGLVRTLPFRGASCPIMNEFFATIRDVYLWIGELEEASHCMETADGRPATRAASAFRLARMIGEDGASLSEAEIDAIADHVASLQAQQLAAAIDRQRRLFGSNSCQKLIVSGHGSFLVEAALRCLDWQPEQYSMGVELGPEVSRCSPAFAIATLATEQQVAVLTAT